MNLIRVLNRCPVKEKTLDHMTVATINYNGTDYTGFSACCEEDEEFYSPKIGFNIAHQRALIEAAYWATADAEREWKILNKAYKDAMFNLYEDKDAIAEADPQNRFKRQVRMAENKYRRYSRDLKILRNELNEYLKAQETVISSLKRQRQNKDEKD
jgi:hypothetical protein